ncbi:MAG TPA: hypothetical protein VGK97_04690 [Spongiibacteraceae bacterium]|jgi:hypothetical protein
MNIASVRYETLAANSMEVMRNKILWVMLIALPTAALLLWLYAVNDSAQSGAIPAAEIFQKYIDPSETIGVIPQGITLIAVDLDNVAVQSNAEPDSLHYVY